jgi:hypothetical protein
LWRIVQLLPRPIVVDDDGISVPNSYVVDIVFSEKAIETLMSTVDTIVGPGVAKIIVGDVTYRGILLC